MCKCRTVQLNEIMHRTEGLRLFPYHKNCGDELSEAQAKKIDEERRKIWEKEKKSDRLTIIERMKKMDEAELKPRMQKCANCGAVASSVLTYCPSCRSTDLVPIEIG